MKYLLALCLILNAGVAFCQDLKLAFRIKEKDLIPEGIAWDKATGDFYVGSIYKNKIVRVRSNGEISDFLAPKQDGVGQVLGLHVDGHGRLWACSNDVGSREGGKAQVHVYDLKSGALLAIFSYSKEGEVHMFNDVFVLDSEIAFVTDSDNSSIFKLDLQQKSVELFVASDQLTYCNGLTSTEDQSKLIVSTARGLQLIDLESRTISRLPMNYLSVADGLYRYKNSLIAVQNIFFPVSIVQYQLNAAFEEVVKEKLLVADHASFDVPTTGVVVGSWFYFIANSQLDKLEGDKITAGDKLREVQIWKVKLD